MVLNHRYQNAPQLILLIFLISFLPGSNVSSQEKNPLIEVMPNGLQIAVKESHTAPVADVRIYVKTGSIYENQYLGTGISHVFEHLINGGTTRNYTEKEINEAIDQLGGANNAYTTKDHTCYFITTSSELTAKAIDIMADWMMNSTFPENEYQRELGIVMEELRKGKEEPYRILSKQLYRTMFNVHPVKFPVIGEESLVTKITHQNILDYYDMMYAPNNMIIVAVGDFNKYKIMDHIKKAFASFERKIIPVYSLADEPKQLGKRQKTVTKKSIAETYFALGYHTVSIDHKDLFALDVLSFILSNGGSSRMRKSLVEEKRLVSSIYAYSDTPGYNAGTFTIKGVCKNENTEPAIQAILQELDKVKNIPVTEKELAKAKKQMTADDILGIQTASSEASELGINLLMTGNPEFNTYYLENIKNVTSEDVMQAANRYLFDDNLSVVMLRPEENKTVDKGKRQSTTHQKIQKFSLDNGIRLLVKNNPNLPLVNLRAMFIGGVLHEPRDKAGISRITAALLTKGTTSRSRDDIATAFDSIGGSYSYISGNNAFGINVEVLKEDFHFALNIFADMLKHPAFDENELETIRQNTLSSISRRNDRWDKEVFYIFKQKFYRTHPYHNDPLGTKESIRSVTTADVRDFYRRFVNPGRCVVSVFGDVDENNIQESVRDVLDNNFSSETFDLPKIEPVRAIKDDLTIIKEVDKSLAAIYLGYPGTDISNPDRYPMIVMDTILSGHRYPGGWLHEQLRGQDKDLVYVVHAHNFTGLAPGYFGITAAASPGKMDEVISIILKNIETIKSERVSEEEMSKAKTICNTMEKLSRQTNNAMAIQAVLDELYGLGFDFSNTFSNRINQVTADDVLRVAKKYLTNYVLVRTKPNENSK